MSRPLGLVRDQTLAAFFSRGQTERYPGLLGAIVFAAVFVGSAAFLRAPELASLMAPVRRKVRR